MRAEPLSFKEFDGGTITTPSRVKPFLPGGRLKGEATPPPPTFSEDQLKKAELESYKRGFLEGTEEGKRLQTDTQSEIDRKLSEALTGFAQAVTPVFEDYKRMAVMLREDVPKAALAIARKVAGAALAENSQAAVAEIAERCIATMLGEAKLTVTVHESIAPALEKRFTSLTAQYATAMEIQVIADAAIATTDCKVQWKQGAFVRNTEQLWSDIERAVGNLSASATYETAKDMEKLEEKVNNPEPLAEPTETQPSPKE